MVSYLFGGNTGETPETLKRKRELAMAIMGAQQSPRTIGEGLSALGAGITAGIMNRRADKAEGEGRGAANALFNRIIGGPTASATPSSGGSQGSVASGATTTSGDVYSGFMDTVKGGITNPYGLAAVASTGNAESKFSAGNANRSWSDPSERGAPGTAGGIMSWRGPRLEALYSFAAQKGEKQGAISPTTQAEFFLQENPQLIAALNNAKSVEEAQGLMNEAWKFAGWNRPGGEAANRMASANAYLSNFQGQPQPREVASLDPSIGMPAAAGEIASTSPQPQPAGNVDPMVSAPNYDPVAAKQPVVQPQPASVQVAQAQPMQGGEDVDPATLYQIMAHPFASPEQKATAQMMLEQQQWRQRQNYERQLKTSDPEYQLGLRKTQAEIEKLGQPGYRMLTGDERKTYGIPEYDTRPYQISREGQVSAVGGAGQMQNPGVEASQREALAKQYGIDPNSAEGQRFILTGSLPSSDRGVTAGDREAIREGEDNMFAAQNAAEQLLSIITPDESGASLNDRAGSGSWAGWQSWAARNDPTGIFDDAQGQATTELSNRVLNQALGSLKSIFGGNPTEGERQILMDLQASVDKTPQERKIIIENAIKQARKKLAYNQDRVNELRGGTYYRPRQGGQPNGQQQPAQGEPDFSKMSDEELERLINGQ